ncbi:MAG: phosphatase domain-containing protein [Sulfobacillus sp.]
MITKTCCIIVDIDGTLADISQFLHLLEQHPKNWQEFFSHLSEAKPIQPIIDLIQNLHHGINAPLIVYATGRPETYRGVTLDWLNTHNLPISSLYMRKNDDHRPDSIIKREILCEIKNSGLNPVLVIDDRPEVVNMWREEGIVCLQNKWLGDKTIPHRIPKLILMVGPSGGGKTTYLHTHWPDRLHRVISTDRLRLDLLGDEHDQSRNRLIFTTLHKLVKTRLDCGLDTIVDATNLRNKDRLAIVNLASDQVSIEYLVCNRTMPQKLRDAGWRANHPDLIERHEQIFKSNLTAILSGDGLSRIHVVDLRKIVEQEDYSVPTSCGNSISSNIWFPPYSPFP